MRSACSLMTFRKRSRAGASSLAAPCSVSTKPLSEASGVLSSWLALATKSARILARRSCSLRSRNEMRREGPTPPDREPSSGATVASNRRSTGTRSCSSTAAVTAVASAWSTASSSSGSRLIGGHVPAAPAGSEQVLGQAIGMHDVAGAVEHDGRLRHGVDHPVPRAVIAAGQVGRRRPRAPHGPSPSEGHSAAQTAAAARPSSATRGDRPPAIMKKMPSTAASPSSVRRADRRAITGSASAPTRRRISSHRCQTRCCICGCPLMLLRGELSTARRRASMPGRGARPERRAAPGRRAAPARTGWTAWRSPLRIARPRSRSRERRS